MDHVLWGMNPFRISIFSKIYKQLWGKYCFVPLNFCVPLFKKCLCILCFFLNLVPYDMYGDILIGMIFINGSDILSAMSLDRIFCGLTIQ